MFLFLRCVGEAVAAKGMRALAGIVPFGAAIYDVAEYAIERYRDLRQEVDIRADVEAMLQAAKDDVGKEARQIAEAVLPEAPDEEKRRLATYLSQVPATARQSLKRPEDPTGTSVPAQTNLFDPIQVANLLPQRPPRFHPGDPVPDAPQWQLVELLGAGGFGEVWLARHTFLNQLRAFKFCLDEQARRRLLGHEGAVVKQVMEASKAEQESKHGIVRLEDAWLEGETPWLAYEYIDGGDLSVIVRQHAHLPPDRRGRRAMGFLVALATVIGRFHTLPRPIIHRDLKPANILIKKGKAGLLLRVTDFGISHIVAQQTIRQATVSTPSLILGETLRGAHTPIYASPQQKRGMKPDVRDDVYALGVIGWQLLVGDLQAERPAGRWRKRVQECQLPDEVLDLLERCWDDDPDERPDNAMVLAERLRKALGASKRKKSRVQAAAKDPPKPPASSNAQNGTHAASQDVAADIDDDYRAYSRIVELGNGPVPWLKENAGRIANWYEAAVRGNVPAMVLLGNCFESGVSVPQDYAKAMEWYRKAADAGNILGIIGIGWLYRDGLGLQQDYGEAMQWFLKAADQGSPAAMSTIGSLYRDGLGGPQDYTQALKWYRKAAAMGNAAAMYNIGWMYHNGFGVQQDYAKAMEWYHKAANAGNVVAMKNIGVLYQNGLGVQQDYAKAMEWYRKAADAGNAAAMKNIGWLYERGLGMQQDYAKAMEWYRKAADAGNARAMNNIGVLYENGLGVEQDHAKAMEWYRKAAYAGNAEAMESIGRMYQNGLGVPQDHRRAEEWFKKARDAGT